MNKNLDWNYSAYLLLKEKYGTDEEMFEFLNDLKSLLNYVEKIYGEKYYKEMIK